MNKDDVHHIKKDDAQHILVIRFRQNRDFGVKIQNMHVQSHLLTIIRRSIVCIAD